MSEQNLEQILYSKNYTEAKALMTEGVKISAGLQEHQKAQIFDNLFREKQYEILHKMVKDKTIETDVYEFDSFDKSIFQPLIRNLSNDDESIQFFNQFITQFDNLNDEVAAKTLLGYFFEQGASIEKIKVLIDAGCNVNFKNNAEESFIHQVIKTNLMKTHLSLSYLELLINEGLDVNASNIVQKTPLIVAIEFNKKEYLDLLLQHGANPNDLDKDGNSAFFYAVAHKQDLEIYTKLREYATPDFDILNKDRVSLFFEYTRMFYSSGKGLELFRKLLDDGADLYQTNIYYSREATPLDLISEKSADILETAIASGKVDVNQRDSQGNTQLHKVCAYNVNYEAERAKETYRKVKLLIENGADISLTNDEDKTALMLASDDNLKIKTVELLMKQS